MSANECLLAILVRAALHLVAHCAEYLIVVGVWNSNVNTRPGGPVPRSIPSEQSFTVFPDGGALFVGNVEELEAMDGSGVISDGGRQ